jgi:hypothetical protein
MRIERIDRLGLELGAHNDSKLQPESSVAEIAAFRAGGPLPGEESPASLTQERRWPNEPKMLLAPMGGADAATDGSQSLRRPGARKSAMA